MTSNEGKVCDAVVKVLEQRTGKTREDIRRPEVDGSGPPVELRLKLGDQGYAIEHTLIEAFERQTLTGVSFQNLVDPVKNELCGELPGPARYTLLFPLDPFPGGQSAKQRHRLQENLAEWIRGKAPLLFNAIHESLYHKPTTALLQKDCRDQITEKPKGFSIEVTLRCEIDLPPCGQKPGILGAARWAPSDEYLKAARSNRIQRAMRSKCPKLHGYKSTGDRTVLVLEIHDIALTNPVVVANSLIGSTDKLPSDLQLPDEIYLVDTILNCGPWRLWPLKNGERFWPADDAAGWHYTEFSVNSLIDLTSTTDGS
ncbi:MAG: hypothetical protein OXB98_02595 [Bryobacterales bacterium]|nr:hypothetical protein [Bryobacterales bacterium]